MIDQELQSAQDHAIEVHDNVQNTWLIDGFSVEYWEKVLTVTIPQDADSPSVLECCAAANKILNVAYNYFARADMDLDAATLIYKRKYRAMVDSIVAKHKKDKEKIPAAATITSLSEHALAEEASALSYLEARAKYWKRMVEKVRSSTKQLETITWNLSTEAKVAVGQT